MKFFSNDAARNETEQQDRDRDGAVASEPVAVPQQRPGSPWTAAPGSPEAEAGRDRRDESSDTVQIHPADRPVAGGRPDDQPVDLALDDKSTTYGPDGTVKDEGTFDDPKAVDPATDKPLDSDLDGERDGDKPVDAAVKDEGTFDDPKAVDPVTDKPLDSRKDLDGDKPATTATTPVIVEPEPVVAATAVPATTATTPAPAGDRIFPDGDSFTDRFRDVQLRFVDSPKDATADAAKLVTEVIDKLADTLKGQQKALSSDSDDTEKLRVELRGYRDILNRLLAL